MKPTTVLKVLPLPYSWPSIAWQILPPRSNSLKKSHVQESLSWALLLGNTTEDVLLCLLEYIYQGSISRKIYRKKAKLSSYSLSSCLPFLGVLSDRGLMMNQFCHLPEHFNVSVCVRACVSVYARAHA